MPAATGPTTVNITTAPRSQYHTRPNHPASATRMPFPPLKPRRLRIQFVRHDTSPLVNEGFSNANFDMLRTSPATNTYTSAIAPSSSNPKMELVGTHISSAMYTRETRLKLTILLGSPLAPHNGSLGLRSSTVANSVVSEVYKCTSHICQKTISVSPNFHNDFLKGSQETILTPGIGLLSQTHDGECFPITLSLRIALTPGG